jgi:hypothetical protein
VRTERGRCFICEPLASLADAEDAGEALPRQQDTAEFTDPTEPDCVDEPLPPHTVEPLPAYAVLYSVAGGQAYTIAIPGDASVAVEDGMLKVYHPGRHALGILRIITNPTLTIGEETHDAAHDHG